MRSWEWEIDSVDFDYRQMMGSLGEFCARQFMGKHAANSVQLLVEEVVAQQLMPVARKFGVENPGIKLRLAAGEEGVDTVLTADFRSLVEACGGADKIEREIDPLSATLVAGLADVVEGTEPGVLEFRLK